MALTVNDLLVQAANLVGIASAGNELGANDAHVMMISLNAIRNRMALELQNQKIYDQIWTASSTVQSFTLGAGGDLAERPAIIDQVTINNGALNWSIPLLTLEEYRNISVPATAGIPCGAYADTGYPLQTIWLFPSIQPGWAVRVIGASYPVQYTNISDLYQDLPEMFQALVLFLAIETADQFGQTLGQGVQIRAHSALKHVRNVQFAARIKDPHAGPFDRAGAGGNIFGGFQ